MALILRSNPKHLGRATGALFVSNPKRKKKATKKRKAAPKRRRNGTKKGMVRKTARKAYSKRRNAAHKRKAAPKRRRNALMVRKNALVMKRNPVKRRRSSKRRVRMNPIRKMIRKNPVKKLIPRFIDMTKRAVGAIPVIGKPIAKSGFAIPLIGGMFGGLAFVFSYHQAKKFIENQSAKSPDSMIFNSLVKAEKFAGFALVGIGSFMLMKSKFAKDILGAETADIVGKSLLGVAGAAQGIRYVKMAYDHYGKAQPQFLEDKSVDSALNPSAGFVYGDGGSYDVVPLAGMHYSGAHDNPHCAGLYMDARPIDAAMAGADLSNHEMNAAQHSEEAYVNSFETPALRAANTDHYSRHAGKHGHRWGWLIKVLGWPRFQSLVMLPKSKRQQVIAKIKRASIRSARQAYDAYQAQNHAGLELMDMSGLVVDSMSGLAVVGSAV